MSHQLRLGPFASMLLAAFGLAHAQQPNPLEKSLRDIAAEFKKGRDDNANKLAVAAAKNIEEISDLMELFRPVNKGGLGIGTKLKALAKAPNAKDATELGHLSAAMAELMIAKVPAKNGAGAKTRKAWLDHAGLLHGASLDLAKAGAKNDAKAMKASVEKIDNACIGCHAIFK